MTEVVSIDRDGAAAARSALEHGIVAGDVVLFPADGLYGLACDPLNGATVERIHRLKGRAEGKPSAVMYFSPLMFRELLSSLGPVTREAAAALLPGPVTLVVRNREHRYPLACGDDPERLGLRLIEGPLAGALRPIFQTSANRSGDPAPASLDEVDRGILEGVDLAIDGGELGGAPSTVIDLSALDVAGEWRILREGALPGAAVEAALAPIAAHDSGGG